MSQKVDNPQVTIKDVARLAKVSPATVSLVMNGRPGVGAETRDRVLRITTALNYRPNLIARSLVKRCSYAVAMLITNTRNPIFPELAAGVEEVLIQYGYSLSIISTHDNLECEAKEIEKIRARGIDGIITSAPLLYDHCIASLVHTGYPVVSVLRRVYDCDELDFVNVDGVLGGYLAIEHLIRLGHRRIGIIKGPGNTSTGVERFEGALKAFRNYEVPVSDNLLVQGDFFKKSGYGAAKELLALPPNRRPTALFAGNDDMALGTFEAILELGFRIPEDIALVGYNNVDATALRMVEITTVSQRKHEMGSLAAKRLIDKIEKRQGTETPFHVVLEPKLIVRKSCGFQMKSRYFTEQRANPLK